MRNYRLYFCVKLCSLLLVPQIAGGPSDPPLPPLTVNLSVRQREAVVAPFGPYFQKTTLNYCYFCS